MRELQLRAGTDFAHAELGDPLRERGDLRGAPGRRPQPGQFRLEGGAGVAHPLAFSVRLVFQERRRDCVGDRGSALRVSRRTPRSG